MLSSKLTDYTEFTTICHWVVKSLKLPSYLQPHREGAQLVGNEGSPDLRVCMWHLDSVYLKQQQGGPSHHRNVIIQSDIIKCNIFSLTDNRNWF